MTIKGIIWLFVEQYVDTQARMVLLFVILGFKQRVFCYSIIIIIIFCVLY